jgi:hypothetical protein
MSYTPDQAADSYDSVRNSQPSHVPNDSVETQFFATKRCEILHHVLPLSSRSTSSRSRFSKPRQHKTQIAPSSQTRSRASLHKYITTLFGNGHDHNAEQSTSQLRFRASSFGSNLSSSMHGSLPSVDFVSSAAFLFSGPSLHSILSASDSTLRLQRHTSDSIDIRPISRQQTDSFSLLDDASLLESRVLEPTMERGMRAMADVLLDTRVNTSPNSYDLEVHGASIEHFCTANSTTSYPADSTPRIAALLLSYLDHTA